jgi:membrane protease YdiL (CAAX protease family)
LGEIADGPGRKAWEPLPSDLVLVLAFAALAVAFSLVMPLSDTPLRAPIGLVLVLFLPGYAIAAALFPGKGGLGLPLRAALSVGLSLATALIIGLVLNFSPWGLRLGPIVASIVLSTLIFVAFAYFRRVQLPSEERFGTGFVWDLKSFLTYRDPTLPALLIVVAELLIFKGHLEAGMVVHGINLIALVLSSAFVTDRTNQALMLLPLFRLINAVIPTFFQLTLYSYALVYAPMFLPIYLILKNRSFSREEIGVTFKNFWRYLPVAVVTGILLGCGEYFVIHPEMLIPNVDIKGVLALSLIMIFFVGVIEEFIFRSVLQTALIDWAGWTKGLLASSLLFGFMHSGYGLYSEMAFVSAAGLVFGLFFWKTKSLPLVSLLHGVTNISLFLIVPFLFG